MGTHLATMGVYNRNRRRTDATNARCPHGTVTPPKLTVITLIAQDIIWRAECTLPSATPYTRQGSCPLRAAVRAAVTRAVTQQSCELRGSEIIGTTMLQSLEVSDITSLHCNGEVLVDGDTLESRGVQTGGEVVMVINLEAVCERERQRKASVGPELKQQGTPDVRVPDATVQQRQAGRQMWGNRIQRPQDQRVQVQERRQDRQRQALQQHARRERDEPGLGIYVAAVALEAAPWKQPRLWGGGMVASGAGWGTSAAGSTSTTGAANAAGAHVGMRGAGKGLSTLTSAAKAAAAKSTAGVATGAGVATVGAAKTTATAGAAMGVGACLGAALGVCAASCLLLSAAGPSTAHRNPRFWNPRFKEDLDRESRAAALAAPSASARYGGAICILNA